MSISIASVLVSLAFVLGMFVWLDDVTYDEDKERIAEHDYKIQQIIDERLKELEEE